MRHFQNPPGDDPSKWRTRAASTQDEKIQQFMTLLCAALDGHLDEDTGSWVEPEVPTVEWVEDLSILAQSIVESYPNGLLLQQLIIGQRHAFVNWIRKRKGYNTDWIGMWRERDTGSNWWTFLLSIGSIVALGEERNNGFPNPRMTTGELDDLLNDHFGTVSTGDHPKFFEYYLTDKCNYQKWLIEEHRRDQSPKWSFISPTWFRGIFANSNFIRIILEDYNLDVLENNIARIPAFKCMRIHPPTGNRSIYLMKHIVSGLPTVLAIYINSFISSFYNKFTGGITPADDHADEYVRSVLASRIKMIVEEQRIDVSGWPTDWYEQILSCLMSGPVSMRREPVELLEHTDFCLVCGVETQMRPLRCPVCGYIKDVTEADVYECIRQLGWPLEEPEEPEPDIMADLADAFEDEAMQPEIVYGDWWLIDYRGETTYFPEEVVSGIEDAMSMGGVPRNIIDQVMRDIEIDELTDLQDMIELVNASEHSINIDYLAESYGARLQMPGYMDSTEWAIFDTEEEAAEYLIETYAPED